MNKSLIIAAIAAVATMTACNHKAGSIAPKAPGQLDMQSELEKGSFTSGCQVSEDGKTASKERVSFGSGLLTKEILSFDTADCKGESKVTDASSSGYSILSKSENDINLQVGADQAVIDPEIAAHAKLLPKIKNAVKAAVTSEQTWNVSRVAGGIQVDAMNPTAKEGQEDLFTKTYLR